MNSEERDLKPSAFVIMPFAAEFTAIYNDFIKAGLEEAGYNVTRADSFLDQHNILSGIVKRITTAKLVIAELTTLNPNVFYELGLCHGLGIPTVLLAQSIDEVPFDLQGYTVQEYSTHYPEILNLKPLLREIGERHLRGEITFGSPVSDFAPLEFQVNHREVIETYQESSSVTPTQESSVDKGILEATIASQAFQKITFKIANELIKTTEKTTPLLNRLDEATAKNKPGSAKRAQALAEQIATELDRSTDRIGSYLPEMSENIDTPMEVFIRYLTTLKANSEESREQLIKYRTTFSGLSEAMPEVLGKVRSLRDSISNVGLRSGIIMPASRRNSEAVGGVLAALERLQAFCQRIVQVCDEKLNLTNEQ